MMVGVVVVVQPGYSGNVVRIASRLFRRLDRSYHHEVHGCSDGTPPIGPNASNRGHVQGWT